MEITPTPTPGELDAIRRALLAAGADHDHGAAAYASAWRRAALAEGVETEAMPRSYVSPRSTRGATRA